MSRLSILTAGILLLMAGGGLYGGLRLAGLDPQIAQSSISLLLMVGTLGWAVFYLGRVVTGKMAFHTQRKTYRQALLKQKLAAMSDEEWAELQAELEQTELEQTEAEAKAG